MAFFRFPHYWDHIDSLSGAPSRMPKEALAALSDRDRAVEDALSRAVAGGSGGTFEVKVAATDASAEEKSVASFLCDGVADDVEIQAALSIASHGRVGGVVKLSSGTFTTSSAINMGMSPDYESLSNTSLEGMGWESTVIRGNIQLGYISGPAVNRAIGCNVSNLSCGSIVLLGAIYCTVENCYISGSIDGSGVLKPVEWTFIMNNIIDGTSSGLYDGYGIDINGAGNPTRSFFSLTVSNNHMYKGGIRLASSTADVLNRGHSVVVEGNSMSGDLYLSRLEQAKVFGNTLEGTDMTLTDSKVCSVFGNVSYGGGLLASTCDKIAITGNSFYWSTVAGSTDISRAGNVGIGLVEVVASLSVTANPISGSQTPLLIDTLLTNRYGSGLVSNHITLPRAGLYEVGFRGTWAVSSVGVRRAMIYTYDSAGTRLRQISEDNRQSGMGSLPETILAITRVNLVAGESVGVEILQTSGGTLRMFGSDLTPDETATLWVREIDS